MEPSPANHRSSPAAAGFDLSEIYVHLGLGARAETLPDFAWSEESLARYETDHQADGDEGRLLMIGPAEATWTTPAKNHQTGSAQKPGRRTVIAHLTMVSQASGGPLWR